MEMNKIFLKYMDIEGYKNFYNRVHVDFSPHLNIVAGPPKFGKSNLLNAINWTLLDTDGTDNTPETIIFTVIKQENRMILQKSLSVTAKKIMKNQSLLSIGLREVGIISGR